MIYLSKSDSPSATEKLLASARKAVADARGQYWMVEGGITLRAAPDIADTLRKLVEAHTIASVIANRAQLGLIASRKGKLGMVGTVQNIQGDLFRFGLTLDRSPLISYTTKSGQTAKHRDLNKGDEFAAMVHHEHLTQALLAVSEDKRSMFRIVAHHPQLIRRMTAFGDKSTPITRAFTLSLDNNLTVSAGRVYTAQPWMTRNPKELTSSTVMQGCDFSSDIARLVAENLVEQACYTDSPLDNAFAITFAEAAATVSRAEALMRKIADGFQRQLGKYAGFSNWGQEVKQDEAVTIKLADGMVGLSGVSAVSFKSAENADMPIIRSIALTRMASVEVQQVRFRATTPDAAFDSGRGEWTKCRNVVQKSMDDVITKQIKAAKTVAEVLKKR